MVGSSQGTSFEVDGTKVGHLSSVGGVSMSTETIDVTALDSTGGYREHMPSFKDGGEVPLSGFFDFEDEGQQALYEAFVNGNLVTCAIIFPERIGAMWQFQGVVTAFDTNADVGDAVKFSSAIKISGPPTLTATNGDGPVFGTVVGQG